MSPPKTAQISVEEEEEKLSESENEEECSKLAAQIAVKQPSP